MNTTATRPQQRPMTAKPSRCRLTLTITVGDQSTDYRVTPLEPGFAGVRAFRLRKAGGDHAETHASYDVVQGIDETTCTCASHEFRHAGHGTLCKHAGSLTALGLLDPIDRPIPTTARTR